MVCREILSVFVRGFVYAFADPRYAWNRPRISDCFVSWRVWAFFGGFSTVRDFRPVVGEALKAFALDRGQASNDWPRKKNRCGRICGSQRACLTVVVYAHCRSLRVRDDDRDLVSSRPHAREQGRGSRSASDHVRSMSHVIANEVFRPAAKEPAACFQSCKGGGTAERSKAAFSKGGKVFPLVSALRRIPSHALALKKYLGGEKSFLALAITKTLLRRWGTPKC